VTGRDDSRLDAVLDHIHLHSRLIFGFMSLLILLAGTGLLAADLFGNDGAPLLPIEFRLVDPKLEKLPIRIDRVRSCSCWHGPRDNAQRKYKFRVVNESSRAIGIDGGPHSVIRLLVAYPKDWKPHVELPDPSDSRKLAAIDNPGEVHIEISHEIRSARISRISGENAFFGVPPDFAIWALPAAPNKVAEFTHDAPTSSGGVAISYPTVVDQPELLPGAEYKGDRLGHGTWTFYVPLPHRFARSLEFRGPMEPLIDHRYYEPHVIFVGVAALRVDPEGGVDLLGFGPAPSDNEFANPDDL
jgi:hypothetical protein